MLLRIYYRGGREKEMLGGDEDPFSAKSRKWCASIHIKKKKYKLICHQVTMIDRRQRGSYLFICFDLEGWGDQSLRAFHIWTWEEIQVACPVGKRAFSERPDSHEQSERRGEDPSVRYHVPRDVHLRNQNPDWNFRLFPFSHFSTDTQQSNPIKLFFSDLLINSDKKKRLFHFPQMAISNEKTNQILLDCPPLLLAK